VDKLLEQRAQLVRQAKGLLNERQNANQSLTSEDRTKLKGWSDELDAVEAKLDAFKSDAGLLARFKTPLGSQGDGSGSDGDQADFFSRRAAKNLADRLARKTAPGPEAEKAYTLENATEVVLTDFVGLPHRPTTLLEVLPVERVQSPTFRFVRQSVRTNNAAPVAPGSTKPTSLFGLVPVDAQLHVVAHLSEPVDKYLAQDVPNLARFVQNELSYGLFEAVEKQVLDGTGVAPQLRGLNNTSGVQVQAFDTDVLTTVRKALTKLELLGYVPSAVVLRPEDWEQVELSQTSGSGEYLFAQSPVDRSEQKLWGVPVVLSTAPATGKGFLLASGAVKLYTDGVVATEWDLSTGFDKNEVRLRVESRYELGALAPAGVVKFDTVEEDETP